MERKLFEFGETFVAALYIFLPSILGAIHGFIKNCSKIQKIFTYYTFIGVGIQGVLTGSLQMIVPKMVASYVQWTYSPFIIELGMANLSFGILGFVSFWLGLRGKIAACIGYGMFLLITGIGHIINLATKEVSPGDVGGFLFSDFVGGLAILIFASLAACKETSYVMPPEKK